MNKKQEIYAKAESYMKFLIRINTKYSMVFLDIFKVINADFIVLGIHLCLMHNAFTGTDMIYVSNNLAQWD